ncbi:hypothetical protein DA798_04800 [Lactobacillus sp. PFC-70]|nr:hypothetical protein DA798_04800 [Lactobacillus sp. PFC-70]
MQVTSAAFLMAIRLTGRPDQAGTPSIRVMLVRSKLVALRRSEAGTLAGTILNFAKTANFKTRPDGKPAKNAD